MSIQDFLILSNYEKGETLKNKRNSARFDVIFVGWYAEWNNQSRLMFEIIDIRALPSNQDDRPIYDQFRKKVKTLY